MEQLPTVDRTGRRDNRSRTTVPRVDVRVVLFTVRNGQLLIALQERGGCRALPRRVPTFEESLEIAGTRILADDLGIAEQYHEQLYSISHHSEGDWTVTVTYIALALSEAADRAPESAAWFSASTPPRLNSVDRMIVDYALRRLRAKLGYTSIAFHLLPPNFTLSEVQSVYEAVLDRDVDKRNFRRRIHAAGLLERIGELRREGSHRPARLYRLRSAHDAESYLTPTWVSQPERKVAHS
jgi:8-oxo-dGTP diphosphatase